MTIPKPSYPAIYAIEHVSSGRLYVGSSVDVERRLYAHEKELIGVRHCNSYLQRTWSKYGKEAEVNRGRKRSEETRQKLREAWIRRKERITTPHENKE